MNILKSRPSQSVPQHPVEQTPPTRQTGFTSRRRRVWHWFGAHRFLSILLLIITVLLASMGAVGAVQAQGQLSKIRSHTRDAVIHLQAAQALLQPILQHPSFADAAKLQVLQTSLAAAQQDFAAARRDEGAIALVGYLPVVGASVRAGDALLGAADEATQGGLAFIASVQAVLPALQGGVFVDDGSTGITGGQSGTSILTAAMLTEATLQYETGMKHVTLAMSMLDGSDLSALPSGFINPSQMAELQRLMAAWPGIETQLRSIDSWLHVAPTLLGINAPERFLVELMDRGELRPTGGFIGAYGVLTIQDGKIQPFTLNDIYTLDTPYVVRSGWPSAPARYSWWPFAGYALRDSNLSFDFPTSAQAGIHLLKQEGGPDVQGVVGVTVPVIARLLEVTGPVTLPEYGVTVTPQNLESIIRHYTETSAMSAGSDLPEDARLTTLHQRFTALLGQALMAKLHNLSQQQLAAVAQIMLAGLHTKDLQIYFSDATAEQLLTKAGFSATLTRGPEDGVTIVDANTTGNKANLFTTANYADTVTIDQQGTVTHHLTITYDFASATNPDMVYYLYNRHYYQTYLRVYVPSSAKLLTYSGFNGGYVQINKTDEPGRQMWGGYVSVQDGVPYTLHFTWSEAAGATRDAAGKLQYSLVFQHQATSKQHLTLTITQAGIPKPLVRYSGILDSEKRFDLNTSTTNG